jgi:hypothetical protein
MLNAMTADPIIEARMARILNPECAAFAPSVTATEIDPGPTVSGKVRG